jgi:hypothetical protein
MPRPLVISTVMTLKTLADVRKLIGHLPAATRAKSTWRHVARCLAARISPGRPILYFFFCLASCRCSIGLEYPVSFFRGRFFNLHFEAVKFDLYFASGSALLSLKGIGIHLPAHSPAKYFAMASRSPSLSTFMNFGMSPLLVRSPSAKLRMDAAR